MKRIVIFIIAFLAISSCRSIEKLVDRGEYDKAVELAAKKLAGKKNIKRSQVIALEKAYQQSLNESLAELKYLQNTQTDAKWGEIYAVLSDLENRQRAVKRLDPIVSKDGYRAEFKYYNLGDRLTEAANNAAEFHYNNAISLLGGIRAYEKETAQDAYEELLLVNNYVDNYKDTDRRLGEAFDLSMTRIAVEMHNRTPNNFLTELELVRQLNRRVNNPWVEFVLPHKTDLRLDKRLIASLQDYVVSPPTENITITRESRQIREGYDYVLDPNGNVQKDSLGNDIKVPKYITVEAEIRQVFREKSLELFTSIEILDVHNRDRIIRDELVNEVVFTSDGVEVYGDERAVGNSVNRERLPEPFPTDFAMLEQASDEVLDNLSNWVARVF